MLPEQAVAAAAGARRQPVVVVAATAGANVFLLTLCAGVLLCAGDDALVAEARRGEWAARGAEMGVVWAAAAALLVVVLLALYGVFLVLEFTVFE